MNPFNQFLLILAVALELSFSRSIAMNLLTFLIALLYLIHCKVAVKKYLYPLAIASFPALGTWFSFFYFSENAPLFNSFLYASRIYVFAVLGIILAATIDLEELFSYLEQVLKVPSKFIYGMMAGVHFLPMITREIKKIKQATLLRGQRVTPFSFQLIFQGVLAALRWTDELVEAMDSHGYEENQARTHYERCAFHKKDLLYPLGLLLLYNICYGIILWIGV